MQKCADEPGTSQVKRSRRSSTEMFDFKKRCIISAEHCSVIKDKKHPDQWKKSKGFCCRTANWGKGSS